VGHHNIAVIPNPIEKWNPSEVGRENIILNVGRFIRSKQQALLIRYFAEINHPDWSLVLVGDGPELGNCQTLAQGLQVADRVLFTGSVRNVHEYYARSKIFAFTSVSEGFPNALGEAMAAGLAAISFDCVAGPADLIKSDKNGLLIPEGDDQQYMDSLVKLMHNEAEIDRLSMAAQDSMLAFNEEKIAASYFDFMSGSIE